MNDYLLDQIIKYTNSKHSLNFYRKAIKLLGEGIVDSELGELKYQIRKGTVKDPAKYFTKLLQDQINKIKSSKKKDTIPKDTYQELSRQDLFKHLIPLDFNKPLSSDTQMRVPYFPGQIPFPTFIGQEFFCFTTYKKKSDIINYKFTSSDGNTASIRLIRGKQRPDDRERGIPSVSHGKLLQALIKAWTDKKCSTLKDKKGVLICYLIISARELSRYLGWKGFGSRHIQHITTALKDLQSYPYYFQLEDIGIKGFGFALLGDIRNIDTGRHKTSETVFEIMFSTTMSYQLYERHVVTKPDNFITIKNELAWKLKLYIEPRLMLYSNFNRNLSELIKDLQLPKSTWHKFKSQRKREFLKASKELNKQKVADNRIISCNIILNKFKTDYKFTSILDNPKQKRLTLK